jgi:hypothetical protein
MGVASGSNQNVNWVAPVNVTVPPGTYSVVDTDRNTWSQNAQSSGAGFARVVGTAPTAACVAGPTRRAVPYGGNCRGCDHPDLTAYGGNGPFGSGTNVSLHRATPPGAILVGSLSPVTSVSSFLQQCMAQGGSTILLVDDEPWYYYFTGYWARFACLL